MAKAYSMDLRERVLKDCDAGIHIGPFKISYKKKPKPTA